MTTTARLLPDYGDDEPRLKTLLVLFVFLVVIILRPCLMKDKADDWYLLSLEDRTDFGSFGVAFAEGSSRRPTSINERLKEALAHHTRWNRKNG